MLRGRYSAIYGEVNVSVSGGYVLQYAGDTRATSFISVPLKIWSDRKLLEPTTYLNHHCTDNISHTNLLWRKRGKLCNVT